MDYSSIQELNNLQKQYDITIDNILNNFASKLSKSLQYATEKELQKQELNHQKMKQEALEDFRDIGYRTFKEIFDNRYENRYSVDSLMNSLYFYIDDDLRPHLSYDVSKFMFRVDENELRHSFNQNLTRENEFDRRMDFLESEASEDNLFYGNNLDDIDLMDYAGDEIFAEDKQVFAVKKNMITPNDTYIEAATETLAKYAVWFKTKLQPQFRMKYNKAL